MLHDLADQFETASEAYARAFSVERDADGFVLKMQEELGELTQAWNRSTGRGRRGAIADAELRRDLENETADLLGHVLLFARRNGIDLGAAIERKWRFRPVDS